MVPSEAKAVGEGTGEKGAALSADDVSAVAQCLAIDFPVEALDRALSFLDERGIRSVNNDPMPWLQVSKGEHLLELSTSVEQPGWVKSSLEAVLKVALLRIIQAEECAAATERVQMLSAASFEGIIISRPGTGGVIEVNERLCELLGASREELLGPETMTRHVAPEDLPGVVERVRSGYEGEYLITGVRKDGSRFRAEFLSKQGRLGKENVRVAAVRDVTEREKHLLRLRESEERFRELADQVFDMTALSQDGVIVSTTGPLADELWDNASAIIGRNALELVAPATRAEVKTVLQENRTGSYEATLLGRDGQSIPVEIVGVRATQGDASLRFSGVRDLRESRRREEERLKLERHVERSARLDSLGALAGGIAHDFNNLLMTVAGNLALLRELPLDGKALEFLDSIEGACTQSQALTKRLLEYASSSAVHVAESIDLAALTREIAELLRKGRARHVELKLELTPHSWTLGDRTTLTQILLNLLANAVDALNGATGLVRVTVRPESQPDERWEDAYGVPVGPGEWILVEVEDSGIGIDEKLLARVFEPFYSTKPDGHGLGLSATLGVVQAHGGALQLSSRLGVGSQFSLLFPAIPAP